MIKNLKLNIKNNQLAEVLQKQPKPEESEPKVKKRVAKAPVEGTPVEEEVKPRAQIIRKAKAAEDAPDAAAQSALSRPKLVKAVAGEGLESKPNVVAKKEETPALEEPKVKEVVKSEVSSAPSVDTRSLPVAPVSEVVTPAATPAPVKLGPKLGAHTPSLSKINPMPSFERKGFEKREGSQPPRKVYEQRPDITSEARPLAPRGEHSPRFEERAPRPPRSFDGGGFGQSGNNFGGAPRSGGSFGGAPRGDYQNRPPRSSFPEGSRPERGFNSERGPRPDGMRGPRPDGMRGPRPDGMRGPRPDGMRGPRPDGMRGPRPDGMRGPGGPRFDHSDRPARPEGDGERPRENRYHSGERLERGPHRSGIRESFSDRQARTVREQQERFQQQVGGQTTRPRLGPTGRHFRDLVPSVSPADVPHRHADQEKASRAIAHGTHRKKEERFESAPADTDSPRQETANNNQRTFDRNKSTKTLKKPADRVTISAAVNSDEEGGRWRKKRAVKKSASQVDETIRPSALKVHLPITVKDLAQEMKLKASQLISKLFMQGVAVTLNDGLDDELTIQLLGHEFGCEITVDRSEDERLQITSKSISEEISESESGDLIKRPPIVAFMGHVDHGKTSLIDAIRKSNRVAGEAGAITQHIGAFSCQTNHGPLTVLDTPGHEAFAAMRERGASVTDVIVLVIAGDEGIKPQTEEAIKHALGVNATILVAINKADKPNFNADNVYRQLAEKNLLPEAWGGQIITVNCSAVTGEGIDQLLEMVALQADVLELRANSQARARGAVIEAELHKGMGNVATILVQNGTLKRGDALVFSQSWGRVKTMKDEFGTDINEAGPSQAARITGLSSLPEAGESFIVVASEREAREIAEDRAEKIRQKQVQTRKKFSMESLLQSQKDKKILHCILRADVQGSVEALRFELLKIQSDKVEINVINQGIGEISESDVQLAAASGAAIIGFHTRIESHAEGLIKSLKVKVRQFDVIYHAVDGVKEMMTELLDKIAEEHQRGRIEVKAVFKSSQLGKIAGCQVIEGSILRSYRMRVLRQSKVIWEGTIASLRRGKDDVKEVSKGFECGVLLNGFNDFEAGDILEAFEITYRAQSL